MSEATEHALDRPSWTPMQITTIKNPEQYVQCCEGLKAIKGYQKRVADFFKPHKRRLDEAKAALLDDERKALQPALDAERTCKDALSAWDTLQERLAREAEVRLRDEARRAEEGRRLEEAAALEREATATGDDALRLEADAMLEGPIEVSAVIVAKATPKVVGIAFRDNWSARVTSLPKLIAFVAAHPQHENLLAANMAALNALARGLKSGMRVEGVEPVCTKTTAAGAAR